MDVMRRRRIGSRIRIISLADGYEVRISSPRRLVLTIFLGFWLAIWTVGGGGALLSLLTALRPVEERLFLGIWLCFWFIAEIVVGLALLWMTVGYERVRIGRGIFEVGKVIFRPLRMKHVPVSEVQNLRAAGIFARPFSWESAMGQWGIAGGNIAFEWHGETLRFGIGLAEDESRGLVETLRPLM